MFISIAAVSSRGNVRANNEDNFYIASEYVSPEKMSEPNKMAKTLVDHDTPVITAICDGIGGGSDGEYASLKVVSSLRNAMEGLDMLHDCDRVTEKLRGISCKIEEYSAKNKLRLVGTTIVMASFMGSRLRTCNVGDSRAYLLRNHKLSQLSMDHSETQRMLNMGILTREEAGAYSRKHVITQYIGMPSDEMVIAPYYSEIVLLKEDDRILLCSDGLSDMVEEETISLLVSKTATPERAAEALVAAALQRGGHDNVTVVVAFAGNSPKD